MPAGASSPDLRAGLLLALPLLVMMLAVLDRSGALRGLMLPRPDRIELLGMQPPPQALEERGPTLAAPGPRAVPAEVMPPTQHARSAMPRAPALPHTPLPPDRPALRLAVRPPAALSGPVIGPTALRDARQTALRTATPNVARSLAGGAPGPLPHVTQLAVGAAPARAAAARPVPAIALPAPRLVLPSEAPLTADPRTRAAVVALPPPALLLPAAPPSIEPSRAAVARTIALAPPEPTLPGEPPILARPAPPPRHATPTVAVVRLLEDTHWGPLIEAALPRLAAPDLDDPTARAAAATFGERLAAAAYAQTKKDVTYDHRYVRIAFPMGDVPEHLGVCTDVVVRAYRVLGLDLQELVHKARAGKGDTNIDHRRVLVLRKFLEQHGEVLPISEFPEDYKPGDLVTFYKPYGRTSKFHIAIVSSQLTPTGRPLIIHNRGYGAKLEDALFKERITGHYRFTGPRPPDTTLALRRAPAARLEGAAERD